MISRSAENCFWFFRHIERTENTARMLSVNQDFVLDTNPPLMEQWFPLVIISGEEEDFVKQHGEDACSNNTAIQSYLVWDENNPSSLFSSIKLARENARTVREIISLEMWEAMNHFWLWIQSKKSRKLYEKDKCTFYEKIKNKCQLIHGLLHNSISKEEPYFFMQLGCLLERSNQTARILDIKYHRALNKKLEAEPALEDIHWLTLLKSCAATDCFLKQSSDHVNGAEALNFLILNESFPRSILHCLKSAKTFLSDLSLQGSWEIGAEPYQFLKKSIDELEENNIQSLKTTNLHKKLTNVINSITDTCYSIQHNFFEYRERLNHDSTTSTLLRLPNVTVAKS